MLMPSSKEAKECARGDIELAFCHHCGYVWNAKFDPRALDYDPSYEASQSLSPNFRKYVEATARDLVNRYALKKKTIIEVGSGDGFFLRALCRIGDNRGIGFDPARTEAMPESGKVKFVRDTYPPRHGEYHGDFVACRHVLEHIEEPNRFLWNLNRSAGRRASAFFFEVPNLAWTLKKLAFWDIYYEHCAYYCKSSCFFLFENKKDKDRKGALQLQGMREGFGGQYLQIEATRGVTERSRAAPSMRTLTALVERFATQVQAKMLRIGREFHELVPGSRVVLWGAGSKAVALLNNLGIQPGELEYVVDINPRKQGTYVPGTGQKIVAPGFLKEYAPKTIIAMNPAYAQEIRRQVKKLRLGASVRNLD